jgi:hypothetical protein
MAPDGNPLTLSCSGDFTRKERHCIRFAHTFLFDRHSPSERRRNNATGDLHLSAKVFGPRDVQHLVELASQGADAQQTAKSLNRAVGSIWFKARELGVRFGSKSKSISKDEIEQMLQMRADGATLEAIRAALGWTRYTVENHWYKLRLNNITFPRTCKIFPPTQFTLNDYQTILALRDQATPWSSIADLFPQYQLGSIKQDFWRFTNHKLSSTDIRTIKSLRQEGKTWNAIADTGDYPYLTATGVGKAYRRMLKRQ